MFFYSSVPLVDKDKCPKASDHNRLADQFNKRLAGPGPACAWNIFFYADSIFLGPRNTATPATPLGVSPPEDEWWKVYYNIELPTSETGEGNWPLALAGTPQGANVMNPLNAYIFGRVTSENKKIEKMGPWAEGNLFDGLVETSRAVHSNSVFWSNSFRQRGAFVPSKKYNKAKLKEWKSGPKRYLPSVNEPVHFSKSLFLVGRSSDHFHAEYASQHVYMRYPPAVYSGSYVDKYTGETRTPSQGILKRKNGAKDMLQWALWAFTFYFKGNEQQRSLFCETKTWDAPVINFLRDSDQAYRGEQVYGERSVRTFGPLNICKVGFDFYKYYTRQNILAPVFGHKVKKDKDGDISTDDMGYAKIEQYRPTLKFFRKSNNGSENNWLPNPDKLRKGDSVFTISTTENYDDILTTKFDIHYNTGGGKTMRFSPSHGYKENGDPSDKPAPSMLFKVSSSSLDRDKNKDFIDITGLTSSKQKRMGARPCLAGYYLQTNAVTNDNMKFVLRIWRNSKVIHETLISSKYSYKIQRTSSKNGRAEAAYIYNKLFYFKNPFSTGKIKFEIVPIQRDGQPDTDLLTTTAFNNHNERYSALATQQISNRNDKIIALGNPYSTAIEEEIELTWQHQDTAPSDATTFNKIELKDNAGNPSQNYLRVHESLIGSGAGKLKTGDMVKIARKNASGKYDFFAQSGAIVFVSAEGDADGDGTKKLFFGLRQDSRLKSKNPPQKHVDRYLDTTNLVNDIKIFKMVQAENFFEATIEPAILLKQRPSFQDAYSLLRAATAKKPGSSNSLLVAAGFDPDGVDQVGHGFYESNKVFQNYIKYGSGANINGAESVKALRQKINYNPLYESARKFVSSYLRMADRIHLINYRVENGRGVLYFRRYNPNLGKKAKSTILDNMEPPLDPSGRFHDSLGVSIDNLPSTRYKPIISGVRYYVHMPNEEEGGYFLYGANKKQLKHGTKFIGEPGYSFLENGSITVDTARKESGPYEINSIREYAPYGYESNEWVMFMNSVHYKNGAIYKPSIYSDIMGFLNNRCHHRSKEYEQTYGEKYDMIREELMRTPTLTNKSRFSAGRRLHLFLSKSSSNYNYVFNTNDPSAGNLDTYGVSNYVKKYRASCPPVSQRPYKVKSCSLVNPFNLRDLGSTDLINPSYVKHRSTWGFPTNVIRVELDRPLSNTGRLRVGTKGYNHVDLDLLKEEPYRTDENAVIEYLFYKNTDYNCKRMMLGDYGANTEVHEGVGYRPQGACFPRFYFLKLIPKVGKESLLDVSPYAQMDFYMRAMAGEFVVPFKYNNSPFQVGSTNWKFQELASRSAEEDPTAYYYVDPREISGR